MNTIILITPLRPLTPERWEGTPMPETFQPQFDLAMIRDQLSERVVHADEMAANAQVLATLAVAEQLAIVAASLENIHNELLHMSIQQRA